MASSFPPIDLRAASTAARRPLPPSLSTPLMPSVEYEPVKRYLAITFLPELNGGRQRDSDQPAFGRYSWIACARCCMVIDCSHTRPGPGSAAGKMPSPPKNAFLIPGTVVMLNWTDS